MPSKVIITRPNTDAITLSLDLHGLKGNTRLKLAGLLIADISDHFSDHFIGANQDLKSKELNMTIIVPALLGHEHAVITYTLSGAASPYSNTVKLPFDPITGVATHRMNFIFK